jgi:hypothetical protein
VLKFQSFTDAADQAGLSRRYGGVHFEDGDLNGRDLGARIGDAAWTEAQTYFTAPRADRGCLVGGRPAECVRVGPTGADCRPSLRRGASRSGAAGEFAA